MKRYRFSKFFIDTTRNIWRAAESNPAVLQAHREELKQEILAKYGVLDAEAKTQRFLEINPPNICIFLEYHYLMYETIDAYVCGQYYPALTGACCIGEAIFNSLILRLRKYYTNDPLYKKIHRKDSFQNWDEAINILSSWGILNSKLKEEYEKLADIRKKSIHLRSISDFHTQARQAINTIMLIVDNLFGLKSEVFFWCPGELYIKKENESIPIVQEYFIPECVLLGYKHRVVSTDSAELPKFSYEDTDEYESREVSDQQFRELRTQWQQQTKK